MTKFPYCCAALQTAQECNMVCIEHSEISWFDGQKEVVTVKACPFCGHVEDDTITLPGYIRIQDYNSSVLFDPEFELGTIEQFRS